MDSPQLIQRAAWRLKPLAEQLHEIRNPLYLAIGTQDHMVPPAMAHEVCRLVPQAELTLQMGLGHLAHEQDPEGTARQILAWCTEQ